MVLAGAVLASASTGPGRFSIDHLAGWQLPTLAAAVPAIGIGALGWAVGETTRDTASIGLFDRWIRPST